MLPRRYPWTRPTRNDDLNDLDDDFDPDLVAVAMRGLLSENPPAAKHHKNATNG